MTPADYAALRAIIDGDATELTPEQAKAIHAELWTLKQRAAVAHKAIGRLNEENERLIAATLSVKEAMRLPAERPKRRKRP